MEDELGAKATVVVGDLADFVLKVVTASLAGAVEGNEKDRDFREGRAAQAGEKLRESLIAFAKAGRT